MSDLKERLHGVGWVWQSGRRGAASNPKSYEYRVEPNWTESQCNGKCLTDEESALAQAALDKVVEYLSEHGITAKEPVVYEEHLAMGTGNFDIDANDLPRMQEQLLTMQDALADNLKPEQRQEYYRMFLDKATFSNVGNVDANGRSRGDEECGPIGFSRFAVAFQSPSECSAHAIGKVLAEQFKEHHLEFSVTGKPKNREDWPQGTLMLTVPLGNKEMFERDLMRQYRQAKSLVRG